jgi:hypothetical protein
MSIFSQNSSFYGQPFRLTAEQKTEPLKVLRELFNDFRLEEIREVLAAFFEVAITTENTEFVTPRQRSNALASCRQIEEILEAAYILASSAK